MKRLISLLSILGMVLMLTVQVASAQSRISWEVRTGIDFATQKLGKADLNTGFGFDGILAYHLIQHTSIFRGIVLLRMTLLPVQTWILKKQDIRLV